MTYKLSAQDLEQVSAYLDDELSPDEKRAFETRLAIDAVLARALAEIQNTRSLLRRAPQRKAPRSFALREDMLPKSRGTVFGSWTTLNFASAVASLVLVLVFAGDIWANGLPLGYLAAPAAEEAPEALMAQEPSAEAADTGLTATATPTVNPSEGAGEIQPYALPENQLRGRDLQAFNLRDLLAKNVRWLELSLATVAILAGSLAWWRRRNP